MREHVREVPHLQGVLGLLQRDAALRGEPRVHRAVQLHEYMCKRGVLIRARPVREHLAVLHLVLSAPERDLCEHRQRREPLYL